MPFPPWERFIRWRSFVAAGSLAAAARGLPGTGLLLLNLCPVKRDWLVWEQAKCPPSTWALVREAEAAKTSLLIIKCVYKGKARSQAGPTDPALLLQQSLWQGMQPGHFFPQLD